MAVADVNHDGLEDVFIGSSKTIKRPYFFNSQTENLLKPISLKLIRTARYEDVDANWVDVNNDGYPDLVVATGGNEYYGKDVHYAPRVYLNDGKAHFTKLHNAFNNLFETFLLYSAL